MVCRKPTDRAKVAGWLLVGLAAFFILMSLLSLATGIRPIFVAEQGAGRQSLRPRSVENAAQEAGSRRSGTKPGAGSQGPRIVVKVGDQAGGLVVGVFVLILGVLFLGYVDELTIDLKQRTYRRKRGLFTWAKSSAGTWGDFAGLRLDSERGYVYTRNRWKVSLVWNDHGTPKCLLALWYWRAFVGNSEEGAHARAKAWMEELRDRLGTVSVDTT